MALFLFLFYYIIYTQDPSPRFKIHHSKILLYIDIVYLFIVTIMSIFYIVIHSKGEERGGEYIARDIVSQ